MSTPLKSVPRADREKALTTARSQLLERFYRCSKELESVETNIAQIDSQLLVLQGLELPPRDDPNGTE